MAQAKKPSQHIQDCFVYLCITDNEFLKMARQNIPAKFMESQVTQDILQLCYDFYTIFEEAPVDHAHDEVDALCSSKKPEIRQRYMKYLLKVCNMEAPNKAYVHQSIDKFVAGRQLNESVLESMKIMDQTGDAEEAKSHLAASLRKNAQIMDLGIVYAETDTPEYYAATSGAPVIPLGLPRIDKRNGYLKAGQLVCFFAGYKVGKTWGCLHVARQGLLHGKRVLYISHEASQDELEQRTDMMNGSLTSDLDAEGLTDVELWEYEEEDGTPLKQVECFRYSIWNPECVAIARQNIRRFGGTLRLKKYNMATGSVNDVERLLDTLEMLYGWVPDILINDYVEKMKLPLGERAVQRDRINEAYIQLKRIADERQMLVVTASQIKTGTLETLQIDEHKIPAEDARKLGNIDLGIYYCQSRKSALEGWFLAWVLVNRSGDQKYGCRVSRNLRCGQFALDTWEYKEPGECDGTDEEYKHVGET